MLNLKTVIFLIFMFNGHSFRVLHWNILKLHKTATNHISHTEKISSVISSLKPDICSLCEVTSREQLDHFKFDHKYFVKSRDTKTGQNCAMLSTIEPQIKPHIFSNYISKHFVTYFKVRNIKFALIGCHLLANPQLTSNVAQRELQARELQRKIIELEQCGYQVILAGDINDFDNNVRDANNSKSISNVVQILKDRTKLINIGHKLKQPDRYTFQFNNQNVMLDHIFVTPLLHDLIRNVKIHHIKEKTFDDSDHDPIVVDFCL